MKWITPKSGLISLREELKQKVCDEFECTLEEFLGRSRKRNMVDARSVYCILMRRHTEDTLMRIAIEIGGRDHASVVNLIRRTENLMEVKDPIAIIVGRIEEQLFNTK